MSRGKMGPTRLSIAIGPANYAGQATAWAHACRVNLGWNAKSFGYGSATGGFGYQLDRSIGASRKSAALSMRAALDALSEFHVVAIDGFVSIGGLSRLASFGGQVRSLEKKGKSVVLISHGTDTRDPIQHMDRVDYSYFKDAPESYLRRCIKLSEKNRNFAESGTRPLLVSTPDLILDNPHSKWLPVCVDANKWYGERPVLIDAKPRVLHVPSRRTPPIKGTQYIEPILSKLNREGVIDAVMPENVRHEDMPALVGSVDVVVDQIQTGSYGVAAVEAMAAGRLVVGSVSGAVRELVPSRIPIADVTPGSLEGFLRLLARERESHQELAAEGPVFVNRYHDGSLSAEVLLDAVS